jgi:hypothetical protein
MPEKGYWQRTGTPEGVPRKITERARKKQISKTNPIDWTSIDINGLEMFVGLSGVEVQYCSQLSRSIGSSYLAIY